MSRENVELMRRATRDYSSGNLDAFFRRFDPNVVLHGLDDWPEARVLYGRDEVRRFYEGLVELVGYELAVEELVDAGDRVIILVRNEIRGRQSGIESEWRLNIVATFRKRKIVMIEHFRSYDEALEAVGLSK